jgi:hypothetical protein
MTATTRIRYESDNRNGCTIEIDTRDRTVTLRAPWYRRPVVVEADRMLGQRSALTDSISIADWQPIMEALFCGPVRVMDHAGLPQFVPLPGVADIAIDPQGAEQIARNAGYVLRDGHPWGGAEYCSRDGGYWVLHADGRVES